MIIKRRSSTMRCRRCAPLIAAVLLVSACDAAPSQNASRAPAPVGNGAVIPSAAPAAPAAKQRVATVLLRGDGLSVADPAKPHLQALPFGTDKAVALEALSAGMQGPPDRIDTNADCGPGPLEFASWGKGLTAYFQDGEFVGWGGAVDLKTADGIGFGSTRAQLVAAYHPTIDESSLGTEFFTDSGLSGILESQAPDAAIGEIWAGMTCVAR